MASKTQIGNGSLVRLGVTKQVANIATEASKEALAIRLIFDDERDYCLRDFPWPWARKYATAQLVTGSQTVPACLDWVFAYRYPSDCLFVRRLVTPTGRKELNPPPYVIGRDDQGRLIYTNQELAELEYTARVTDPEEFDALFVSMLEWKLASVLAPSLSRLPNLAVQAIQMYEIEKTKAQSRALNEGQADKNPEAEWIRERS